MLSSSTSLPARRQRSLTACLCHFLIMHPCYSSQSRLCGFLEEMAQGHRVKPVMFTPRNLSSPYISCHKDSSNVCSTTVHKDSQCPVCLQTTTFPVQTNCGHLFCAPCLITYWRHGSWLDAISCPLCRQKVSVLCQLFNESRSDRQSKLILGEITDYNRRYSGTPRRMTDYLCDVPLLLQLMARGLGTMGGLLWLFFFRVALCCVGTVVSFSSSSLEPISSSAGSQTDPSLSGLLGVLDDLVVVILLLICVINVNQQMVPQRRQTANAATTHTVIGNSL